MRINTKKLLFDLFYLIPFFHFLSIWIFESKLPIFSFVSTYIIYLSPSVLIYSLPFWIQIFNGLTALLSMFLVIYPLSWLELLRLGHFPRFSQNMINLERVKVFGFLYVFICIWFVLPDLDKILYIRPSFYDKGPSEVAWLLAGVFITALYFRFYLLTFTSLLMLLYTGSRAPALACFVFMVINLFSFSQKNSGFSKIILHFLKILIILLSSTLLLILLNGAFRTIDISSDTGRFESINFLWNWIFQNNFYIALLGIGRDKFGSFGDTLGRAELGVESVILTDFGSFGVMGLYLWAALLIFSIIRRDFLSLTLIIICAVSVSQYSFTGFFYFIGSYFITRSYISTQPKLV